MDGIKPRLAYLDYWLDPAGDETIAGAPEIDVVRLLLDDDDEENWRQLATAHGYQTLPSTETPIQFQPSRQLIERCPNLLCVAASGAGYDMFDVDACTEAGVLVVNQSGSNAESVVQHVLGMMLAISKQMIQSDRAIRRPERDWTRRDYAGGELTEKTLGIIGLGNIGGRLAEICSSVFAMQVIAYDPYITADDFTRRHARCVDLDTLLRESDFVSVNCPLTGETRGMVGSGAFDKMKSTAIFINTGRGGIHDELALALALAEGRLAGAGLDVFEVEPPAADHPLLGFDNVIVSPHQAGITAESQANMARWAAEQWITIFAGGRPPRLINPDAWDGYRARFEDLLGRPVSEEAELCA